MNKKTTKTTKAGASPVQQVGYALSKTGKATLLSKIDPAAVPEGAWTKGLPPIGTGKVEPETGELIQNKNGFREIPPALEDHILTQYGQGVSQSALEHQYELSRGYVARALIRRFGSQENYHKALKGLVSELGIACAEHTLANVEKLHPSQSGMLVGTMVGSLIALEKHERDIPQRIDFGALAEISESLRRMEEYAGVATIEVEAEIHHLDSDARQEVEASLASPQETPSDSGQ